MVYDVPGDPDTDSTYECLGCGKIVRDASNPGTCSACGGSFQNRAMSLE